MAYLIHSLVLIHTQAGESVPEATAETLLKPGTDACREIVKHPFGTNFVATFGMVDYIIERRLTLIARNCVSSIHRKHKPREISDAGQTEP